MNPTEKHAGPQHFLYDADLVPEMDSRHFEPEDLARSGMLRGHATGRGATHFMELAGRQCVLRHYRRGGLVASLLDDRYLRVPLRATRAWREWHLLAELAGRGLPVPQPVAARVVTRGPFYRADLVTLRIPRTRTLAEILRGAPLEEEGWRAIGGCIGRFHGCGVFHADLNAHNILLAGSGEVYLVDFDRGEIRTPAPGWQRSNLERLRRSLHKLTAQDGGFGSGDWQALLGGYSSQ